MGKERIVILTPQGGCEERILETIKNYGGLETKAYHIGSIEEEKTENRLDPCDLIILTCEMKCRPADCTKTFVYVSSRKNIPFVFIRRYFVNGANVPQPGFICSSYKPLELSVSQRRLIDHIDRPNTPLGLEGGVYLSPIMKILAVQKAILNDPNDYSSISTLAELIGVSTSWLSVKFREFSGWNLNSFIRRAKCCYSLYKLISLQDPVKAIAPEAGYHPNSFARAFRTVFKMNPYQIRIEIDRYLFQ